MTKRERQMERLAKGIETRKQKLYDLGYYLDYQENSLVILDNEQRESDEPKVVRSLGQ